MEIEEETQEWVGSNMDTWDTGGTGEAVAPLGLAVPTLAVENGWILAVGLSDAA